MLSRLHQRLANGDNLSLEDRMVMLENVVGMNLPRITNLDTRVGNLDAKISRCETRLDREYQRRRLGTESPPEASHRGPGAEPPGPSRRPPASTSLFDFSGLETVEQAASSVRLQAPETDPASVVISAAGPEPAMEGTNPSHGSGASSDHAERLSILEPKLE